MSFSNQNTTGIQAWIRPLFLLVLFLGLFFGVSLLQEAAAGESSTGSSLQIEWESVAPGHAVKVVNGKPARISFRVITGENVSRVKFGISRKDRSIGITISPEEVDIHEGIAGSIVEFDIPRGMPLGRHNLEIRVIEPSSGRVIGTGILPFILLPSGLECMC